MGYVNHFNTYKNVGILLIVKILLKQLFVKLDYLVSHVYIVISNVKKNMVCASWIMNVLIFLPSLNVLIMEREKNGLFKWKKKAYFNLFYCYLFIFLPLLNLLIIKGIGLCKWIRKGFKNKLFHRYIY